MTANENTQWLHSRIPVRDFYYLVLILILMVQGKKALIILGFHMDLYLGLYYLMNSHVIIPYYGEHQHWHWWHAIHHMKFNWGSNWKIKECFKKGSFSGLVITKWKPTLTSVTLYGVQTVKLVWLLKAKKYKTVNARSSLVLNETQNRTSILIYMIFVKKQDRN